MGNIINTNSITKWSETLNPNDHKFLRFLTQGFELMQEQYSIEYKQICYLDLSGILHISDTKKIYNTQIDSDSISFSDAKSVSIRKLKIDSLSSGKGEIDKKGNCLTKWRCSKDF